MSSSLRVLKSVPHMLASQMVELGDVERSVNLTLMNLHGAMQLYRCVDDEAEWRKKEEKVFVLCG